jgi:hypothetical protein
MTIATTAPAPTRSPDAHDDGQRSGSKRFGAKRLAVVAAVVAGVVVLATATGVSWTGASEATTGVRLQADTGQGATLTVSDLEPGDSASRTVTIRNSSSGDSRLSFEENAAPATFADGQLHLRIEQDGRTVYDGPFGGMNDVVQDVGSLAPGGSSTFTFTVSLPDSAPFANQGEPAVATYSWVTSGTTE